MVDGRGFGGRLRPAPGAQRRRRSVAADLNPKRGAQLTMDQEQQQTTRTCEQCGGAELHTDQVRSAFWHDDRLVVIEDVPALVCGSCHEQFFDDATVMLIDLLRGEGFPPEKARGELRVPVFSLQDRMRRNNGS